MLVDHMLDGKLRRTARVSWTVGSVSNAPNTHISRPAGVESRQYLVTDG